MKKVLLLSPFPPTQNPRLLKEYNALLAHGYHVKVIHGEKDKWSSKLNKKSDKNFIRVGGKPGSILHLLTRIIQKLLTFISPVEWNYNRVSWLMYFKAIFFKADLYIGHNLAALPVAAKLAKLHHSKYAFDAEDFYRQIDNDNITGSSFQKAKYLEDKYLAHTAYLTAASPLIAKHYAFLYPSIHPIVINNVFSNPNPKSDQYLQQKSQLKLFWFSQTIGLDRGIQTVLEALSLLKHKPISLTLLGFISPFNKQFLIDYAKKQMLELGQLVFLDPVEPDKIFEIASEFDIGMALETGFCLNNNLALSNKLFTYIASGLAVLATKTAAQKQFIEKHPNIGKTFGIGDHKCLAELLDLYYQNANLLNEAKGNSRSLAIKELNWDNESKKFINLVDNILSH